MSSRDAPPGVPPCPVCRKPPRQVHTPMVGWRLACCVAAEQRADPEDARAAWASLTRAYALLAAVEKLAVGRPSLHLLPEQGGDRWMSVRSTGGYSPRCATAADALIELAQEPHDEY